MNPPPAHSVLRGMAERLERGDLKPSEQRHMAIRLRALAERLK